MKWLLAIALVGCTHKPNDASLVDVRRDDLVVGVDVEGELQAVDSLNMLPPPLPGIWDFKIANMAPEGIEVKPGDPIMAFDASEQIRDLENMKNEADSADKKLRKKRDDAALARRDD